jgi:hypothetical protein
MVLLATLLNGCAARLPVTLAQRMPHAPNSCLPVAIITAETLKSNDIDSRVLIIHTGTFSHATVVYLFPREQPQVWVWDMEGPPLQVSSAWTDANSISVQWLQETLPDEFVVAARFL